MNEEKQINDIDTTAESVEEVMEIKEIEIEEMAIDGICGVY